MERIPKFNKRRAFNKAVGPGKKSKIDKYRAYVYSGLYSADFANNQPEFYCGFLLLQQIFGKKCEGKAFKDT